MKELPKNFDHAEAEPRIYAAQEEAGLFKPQGEGDPYSIVIPPPNVTGSLHVGHALNNTLQDILCRYQRRKGRKVLWQYGVDHAGIATQMVVERQMAERQEPHRRDIGRDAFVQKVWDWKAESGGMIKNQLKRLGASLDWSRERFTMDEGLSAAVRKVFVQLYGEGLIYRDKRLVNWDPKFQTAISDLEVENNEVNGKMWHFAYPLVDGEVDGIKEIVIATTRPETMLGDGAVAVHPDDERYTNLIGKKVRLPIVDREISIIADEYPDPELGTGAVKITGAHDFNDFEVAKRHDIPLIVLMDEEARMMSTEENNVPERFHEMDRFEARKLVVQEIEAMGLLRGIEDKLIMQPFGDRSGVVIEPMLTDQWYVDAKTLAVPAVEAVRSGKTKFVPENWSKTYYNWMDNIEPWCISRQLWWGHRIPVWYGPDGTPFCAEDEASAHRLATEHYGGEAVELAQDSDVLDTWFSSALWPFSTLGWPEETDELKAFYPTAVLSTAFDIIFFWVARMMMMAMHFQKEVPFETVYIHAIVRDENGQKMSKSKGNVVDPLEYMDEFGADPLRFTLAAQATQGRDLSLSKQRVEGYRNFRTKLWNASRFLQMKEAPITDEAFDPEALKLPLNRWIAHEASAMTASVAKALDGFRFDEAASAIYQFAWGTFCDWYLELSKPVFDGGSAEEQAETRLVMGQTLRTILVTLEPFMPFVTREIYEAMAEGSSLEEQSWPTSDFSDEKAAAEVQAAVDLISEIRSARTEVNVPVGAKLTLVALDAPEEAKTILANQSGAIGRLARIETFEHASEAPKGSIQIVSRGTTYALPVADVIDLGAEVARLDKAIGKTEGELKKANGKLSNERFVQNAPAEVVAEERSRVEKFSEELEQLNTAKARLEAL
ncbi:valine--tRNA ligase [Parvularcula sp. ZS-1/3]|uniref:Valine--tRNA ligase n=1 Tax=Parvularcula mediterranea TaxID=2732508 RepID=A0A7Y3RJW3_9PROT|nr:valine--tRNA ligase [Parvularcula mediterranea]NNU15423.1 valine--tRNA ligase [Parvularcula mediterranea]